MTTGEIRNFDRETGPWIPERRLITKIELILEVWEGMNMCQIESVNTEWELSSVATPVPELLILPTIIRDPTCAICVPPYITVLGSPAVDQWVSTVIILVIYEERKKKGLVVRYMNNEVFNPNGNSNPFFLLCHMLMSS